MRTYTLLFSILAHVAGAGALIVVPIVASNALPDPLQLRRLVLVTAVSPPVPPPVARPYRSSVPGVSRDAAPVSMPAALIPESYADPSFDSPLPIGVVPGGIAAGPAGENVAPPPPPPPEAPRLPVRVGGSVRPPQKIIHVAPEYPAIARAAHVTGVVILEALIDEVGNVRDVRVLRSAPLLDDAAADAVRQWRFSPTLLNGDAVPVLMTVTVRFDLN